MRYYSYIFVRQDIKPEQQMVQVGHVCMQMGDAMADMEASTIQEPYDATKTHFVLVGVRNLQALLAVDSILDKFGYLYERFIEDDLNNEMTAIATFPIKEIFRGPLQAFNTLKI